MYDQNYYGQGYPRPMMNPDMMQQPMPGMQQPMMQPGMNQPMMQPGMGQPMMDSGMNQPMMEHSMPNIGKTPHQSNIDEGYYTDMLLRQNRGKMVSIFCTYPESNAWRDREFKGIIESCEKDHTVINEPSTRYRHVIINAYISYITFYDEMNREYPL